MTGGPDVVETHVSVLVFTGDLVLKYKKSIRLPFVDFKSRPARLAACRAEVEANRRLSPDVYLGVADVTLDGSPLDHAVVMRRLPAERSMSALAERGDPLLDTQLPKLAALLVDFHARADRSPAIDADASVDAVSTTWATSLDVLAGWEGRLLAEGTVARARHLVTRYLRGRRALFDERIGAGRVCDGHGDLLASDVFLLDDGPRVLDCIDFDDRLRHVDVIADVAFLAMDLERLGVPGSAEVFLRLYQAASGDEFPPTLLHHYLALRAVIRAEVACLRAGQDPAAQGSPASDLMALALDHLERARVVVGVVCGLPGTGKSTIAGAVGPRLGWPVLRTDDVRRELLDSVGSGPLRDAYGEGAYDEATTTATYSTLLARARAALEGGRSVLLDGTFSARRWQQAAEQLAEDTGSDLAVFECTARPSVAGARLRARSTDASAISGADEDVGKAMAADRHPWARAQPVDTSDRSTRQSADVVAGELRVRPRTRT